MVILRRIERPKYEEPQSVDLAPLLGPDFEGLTLPAGELNDELVAATERVSTGEAIDPENNATPEEKDDFERGMENLKGKFDGIGEKLAAEIATKALTLHAAMFETNENLR